MIVAISKDKYLNAVGSTSKSNQNCFLLLATMSVIESFYAYVPLRGVFQ